MSKRIILLLTGLTFCYFIALGQGPKLPTIVPASPEASALAKYINYPVNYGTGLVNINIPLYEIKVGDLTLPISLSYHASGIKVNENSGWVGLGWTLNAEPKVSRSVQGMQDEYGYLINNFAETDPSLEKYYEFMLGEGIRSFEEEPDEFYYKLLSKSGGFYLNKKPRTTNAPGFVMHPYEPILIDNSTILKIRAASSPYQIDTFRITDDNGAQYLFTEIEKSITNGNLPIYTCWKATEIKSSLTSDVISFLYQPGSPEITRSFQDKVVVQDDIKRDCVTTVWEFVNEKTLPSGCLTQQMPIPIVTDYVNGQPTYFAINQGSYWGELVKLGCSSANSGGISETNVYTTRLSEIYFRGGKVTFTTKTYNGVDRLDAIAVYNNNQVVKQIKFNYSYFESLPDRARMLLDYIQVLDKYDVVVEEYKFEYNHSPNLPTYFSKSIDYWGYYNGAPNDYGKSLVPKTQVTTIPFCTSSKLLTSQIGNADRNPNLEYTQAMTLQKIIYPTKGYTEFVYQPNQYKEGGILKNAGGLRIYKIKEKDSGNAQLLERTFYYGINEDGEGNLRSPINVDAYSCEYLNVYGVAPNDDNIVNATTIRNRVYYSDALTDLFYSTGSSVTYDHVTEYLTDASGNSLGKTVYEYSYGGTGGYLHYKVPGTTLFTDAKTDWMFGKLLSKTVYSGNKKDGKYKLESRVGYTYSLENYLADGSIFAGKAYRKRNIIGTDNLRVQDICYVPYTIYTGAMVLKSDTTTSYFSSGKVVEINDYTYANKVNLLPTRI
ncbi:MAG TPA: hypothetical protein VHO90_21180, partial [Bacteroidales bacterium]|nr:hypothetical protein [Bacteroidales bacterium]